MIRFAREYGTSILQQPVAKLPEQTLFAGIPRIYHRLLIFFVHINRFSSDVVAYWLFYIIAVNKLNAPSASNFDAA